MNTRNPAFGDWSAFDDGCIHLVAGRGLLERVDRESLSDVWGGGVICTWREPGGFRGFATDRITHAAMNAYARNSPYRPKIRRLPRLDA